MKRWAAALVFVFIYCLSAFAQAKVTVSGTVVENDTSLPMMQAAVQLLSPRDSSSIAGTVTDLDGRFTLRAVPADYIVKFSYLGFTTRYLDIHVTPSANGTDLDVIRMEPDNERLENSVVTAKAPIVTVVADTVVYNPEAFRLDDDAMLEDLLKKIPGLEIKGETITLQGRAISELLINGERFFSGNVRTGIQSLSADMVDKINAYERESDFARITGIDDGEEVPVLDIRIKKNMLDGWKGNTNTGAGSDWRYALRLNANNIKKDKQNTVMASWRNINDKISLNNASRTQLGGGSGGDNSRREAGYTFSSKWDKGKMEGNVHYNGNRRLAVSDNEAEHIVASGNYFTDSHSNVNAGANTPKGDVRVEWRPVKNITLVLKPTFNWNVNDSFTHTLGGNYSSDPSGISDSTTLRAITKNNTDNGNLNLQNKFNGSIYFQVTRRFDSKKGRSLTFAVSDNSTITSTNTVTRYRTRYYKIKRNPDSVLLRRQYTDLDSYNHSLYGSVSYNEPLGNGWHFQTILRTDLRLNESRRNIYDLKKCDSDWEIPDNVRTGAALSHSLPSAYREYQQEDISSLGHYNFRVAALTTNVRYVRKKLNMTAGFIARPQHTRLTYLDDGQEKEFKTKVFTFSPNFKIDWKPKKTRKFTANYRTNTGNPSVYDLLPISSGTNPLYLHFGNPKLEPSITHNFQLSYNHSNVRKQNSLICNASYKSINNSVSNSTIYDTETGGRTVTPMNIDGKWTANFSVVYNKTFDKEGRFSISEHLSGQYDNNVSFLYNSKIKADEINTATRMMLKESLDANYRNDWLELTVNLGAEGTDEHSLLRPDMDQRPYTLNAGFTSMFIFPMKLRLTTSFATIAQRGFSYEEFNREYYVLNASLSKTIKKKATLKLEASDLLHQLPNLTRAFSAERRSITVYNGINSYVLARFIYRFDIK